MGKQIEPSAASVSGADPESHSAAVRAALVCDSPNAVCLSFAQSTAGRDDDSAFHAAETASSPITIPLLDFYSIAECYYLSLFCLLCYFNQHPVTYGGYSANAEPVTEDEFGGGGRSQVGLFPADDNASDEF